MVSTFGDGSDQQKRNGSLPRASLSGLTPLNTNRSESIEKEKRKKFGKRASIFHLGSSGSSEPQEEGDINPLASEKPRTLHKGSGKFGSLGRKSTYQVIEKIETSETTPSSPIDSIQEQLRAGNHIGGMNVLHHGEVQTTSGLFRKKKEYLVLTETHLIRYKSQSRAADAFKSIPNSNGRNNATRHSSTTSIPSLTEIQSHNSRSSAENDNAIPLYQIVAAYNLEDGRPWYTTEVVYLDEESNAVGSFQLMLQDPREADLWRSSIRAAAQKARLSAVQPYPVRVVNYLVQVLEAAQDYDENHFKLYRVARRAANKVGGRSSSDDLNKLGSSVCYMVIGINRLHLISLPDFSGPSSRRYLDAKATKSSFGLVTLVTMEVQHADDSFELGFRSPVHQPVVLELAASSAPEIATLVFRSILYLKPQWLDYTFLFSGPPEVLDESDSPPPSVEDSGNFDRTLIAYCSAYKCDPCNIRYTVDLEVEDAPEFRLLPPANFKNYTWLELLAIMRALRYNESFRSISFNGIELQNLYGFADPFGTDHVAWTTRSGIDIRQPFNLLPEGRSLLYQEVQALALKSHRLRRMDFGFTLPKRQPRDNMYDEEVTPKDPGCEIAAAVLPLCRAKLTNVDWIIFRGIELGETDLEEFAPQLSKPLSHFRCVDVSRCGLNDRSMQIFLNHLSKQGNTVECINISDNPGRLHLGKFPITMSRFSQIRKLDLSRATSASGDEPLIAVEVMLAWRLEELILTGVPVNDKTLDAISTYVAADISNSLHYLEMDQCNLTGAHVAILMRSMNRVPGVARELHLHVSANRLENGNNEIVKAIEENFTPSQLTMRMVEYHTESRFRQLLHALRRNTTIRILDISKASLPYDAGEETCAALQSLFEENTTLELLDISGEQAHLEVARFGIGLSYALTGLKKNTSLKVLKIEYQNLGMEGANTLSSVLEENKTLTEIYCEHNDINLQGFTVLVNSLASNYTVLSLPLMLDDQSAAAKRMKGAISDSRHAAALKPEGGGTIKHSMRKTLTSFGVHLKENPLPSPQDIDLAVSVLNDRWARQIERITEFLDRNRRIASGIDDIEMHIAAGFHGTLRPYTAESDSGIIDQILTNTTPKFELGNPLDTVMNGRLEVLTLKNESRDQSWGGLENGTDLERRPRSMSQLTAIQISDETGLEKAI